MLTAKEKAPIQSFKGTACSPLKEFLAPEEMAHIPKVQVKPYLRRTPKFGENSVITKVDFKQIAKSKIGYNDNINYEPGTSKVKIFNEKLAFREKAASKIGYGDNLTRQPAGGKVQIFQEKLSFRKTAAPKISSFVKEMRKSVVKHSDDIGVQFFN